MADVVYIAFGSGGGSGTAGSPFLADTAARFDEIMRGIAPGLPINIAAGTYPTKGMRYGNQNIGWNVKTGWTITGAGETATIIKLESWPPASVVNPGTASSKWSVIGCPSDPQSLVANVFIEKLTVDGNWLNLANDGNLPPGHPTTAQVALHCVACSISGPITHRNVTVTEFYGYAATNSECFALSCHGETGMDPGKYISSQLAVFDRCTAHHGHGDYCVGIASFHPGPSIIDGCQVYSLPGLYSKGIQPIGKDIQITNNIVRDTFLPFYVDTGNIINLLLERNQFISTGPSAISTNPLSRQVFIEFRADDVNGSMDGVYLDVPIRRVQGAGAGDPLYRIRFWLSHNNSDAKMPPVPAGGDRVKCSYPTNATIAQLNSAVASGLDLYFEQTGSPFFVNYAKNSTSVVLSPVTMYSLVDIHTNGSGAAQSGANSFTFSADKISNVLTKTSGTLPDNGTIVTVSGGALPLPLTAAAEWIIQEVSQSTFKLAWVPQTVVLQAAGTGSLIRSSTVLGTFTATADSSSVTIANPSNPLLKNGDIVYVSNSGGLPAPLVADRPYTVRDVSPSGLTFKLAWSEEIGEWIRHSQGVPFVSDESKVYIQSSWSWTNWKIRNNYLEVPFLSASSDLSYQSVMSLTGNGSTDRDYQIADNVIRFTGVYDGKKMYNILMDGIDYVTILNNAFDYRPLLDSGEMLIYRAEKPGDTLLPIDVLYRFGNKTLNEEPHPWLPDDLHSWASIGKGEAYVHGNAAVPKLGLRATTQAGTRLHNDVAATAVNQQVSPATEWAGQGWASTPEESQPVAFRAYVSSFQEFSSLNGKWNLESSINGGEFVPAMSVSRAGSSGTHKLEVISIACVNATFLGNGSVDFTDANVAIGKRATFTTPTAMPPITAGLACTGAAETFTSEPRPAAVARRVSTT